MIGWLVRLLRARRDLATLGQKHEELLQRYRLTKLEHKASLGAALQRIRVLESQLQYRKDQIKQVAVLEHDLAALREENGKNYNNYVLAQHRYEEVSRGRVPRL